MSPTSYSLSSLLARKCRGSVCTCHSAPGQYCLQLEPHGYRSVPVHFGLGDLIDTALQASDERTRFGPERWTHRIDVQLAPLGRPAPEPVGGTQVRVGAGIGSWGDRHRRRPPHQGWAIHVVGSPSKRRVASRRAYGGFTAPAPRFSRAPAWYVSSSFCACLSVSAPLQTVRTRRSCGGRS